MGMNILVGVPSNCPPSFQSQFSTVIRDGLGAVDAVHFASNMDEYYSRMSSSYMNYDITVILDELGEFTVYLPFMDGFRHRYPSMKVIVIVPDYRQGGEEMRQLLVRGYYNALFQSSISPLQLRRLAQSDRTPEEAATYYGVEFSTDEYGLIRYGEDKKEEKSNIRVRLLGNGVKITRMFAGDVKRVADEKMSDEDAFSFLNTDSYGMDKISNSEMKLYEFPLEEDWMEEYRERLNSYYRKDGLMDFQAFDNGQMSEEEFTADVHKRLAKTGLTTAQKYDVTESFIRSVRSYGKLDVVLDTEDVSDIRLMDKDTVNVQMKGEWYATNIKFRTPEEFEYYVRRLCTKNRVSLNQVQAQLIFSDIDTNENARLRFAVTSGLLNSNRISTAHIRKINKRKKLFDTLIKEGMLTPKEAGFLISAMRNKKSIAIGGGSGSGKTVLLNALIEYADDNICGACVQEAEEIFSDTKKNMEFSHSISNKGEGKVEHTLAEIATAALLKNASLFIIGEIKGKEARDFFTASNTGAQCMCTTHALSVFEILPRIADLAKYAGDYTQEDLLKMLSRGIDMVVHMEKYRVNTIGSVVGWDEERKDVEYDIYDFDPSGEERAG